MSAQLENGFTRIANEILEELSKTLLSSYEWQVLMCVFRKTYGFNKKVDKLPVSQIVAMTGIHQSHVSRTIKKLTERKIVTRTGMFIEFNTELAEWLPKQVYIKNIPKQVYTHTQTGIKNIPKQADSIYNTKETIQKKVAQTSKNSLTACTQKELEHIAETKGVDLEEVIDLHENILLKIQDGIFQKKGYGKTVYFTLINWITRDLKEINKRKKQKRKDAFNGIDVI